ncbi:L-lactate permease [Clostridium paridis]|uniref:L-lactate permease n=1 Tax=Clostridium paridis TaxID=2803863 RepID=A0A937K5R2_9CLOT|nr:L-lactate permease [Clostridium paridis]MBL4932655.1 L-lactate permease [Clostridium paridis]
MNNYVLFLIALLPIIWLMVSLGKLKIPGYKAIPIALVITIVLAVLVWKVSITNVFGATLEGFAMGLWPIMIVIIAAVFTYNLTLHTGGMDVIKKIMTSITTDKRILVLILAWGFGGFLEAVAGFGTAVAIPASIMVALGFEPVFAAVICLMANTTPTAFGAVGLPVSTLANVTGIQVAPLSYAVSMQLFALIIVVPIALVMITGKSVKAINGVLGISIVSGLAFAVPQVIVAKYLGAELPAILGSVVSMGATILWAKIFHKDKAQKNTEAIGFKKGLMAWLPFILVFSFILLASPLISAINGPLASIKTSIKLYHGVGGKPYTFQWITAPGTLIIIATYLAGFIQGFSFKEITKVLFKTIKQMSISFITILSIVALAKVMQYSGMIKSIAVVLVAITGPLYPLIAPIIGALGTFVTGSDTSANVLFGGLQVEAAKGLNLDPYWLAAANTVGATAGKMISPQSIAVATAATGLSGKEGTILNSTLKFCLVYVVVLGLIVFLGGRLIGV